MNYQKLILFLLISAFFVSGCQQGQQTDFNTYSRKTQNKLKNSERHEEKHSPAGQIPQVDQEKQSNQPQQNTSFKRDTDEQHNINAQQDTKAQQDSIALANSNDHLLLGNPSGATISLANANNYLIDHTYFVESYSKNKAQANWVAWHLDEDDLGNARRGNNFRPDINLPEGWYQADDTSFKGSGFDKGHYCPSGDRTSSTTANSATFLMNNIIPQAPNNNQKTWEHLESYARNQVKRGNEAYIIMGSYGTGGTGNNGYRESIDKGRINVPARIWKVIIFLPRGNNDLQRINANTKVIAIDTPNDNNIIPNWMSYICTVRDIEKATGYDLFSALPKAIQDRIEIQKFKGGN